MTFAVLGLFAAILTVCVVLGVSLIAALAAGYVLFFVYALTRGLRAGEVLKTSLSGVLKIKNILMTFVLIGMLTGLWRASGTIASIVDYAAVLIRPSLMLLLTFLFNCLVSMLTGTAFGTAATMGTICATMALTMHIDPLYTGGAVLAGAFFGDRCSPVSTSALLVSELTETDIFGNIRRMLKSAVIPFLLSSLLYFLIGTFAVGGAAAEAVLPEAFGTRFRLGVIPLIPALAILILALCRVKVKAAMAVSVLSAALICLFYQGMSVPELLRCALCGYEADSPELAALMNGGGIASMISVSLIVCISSCYAGIFEASGLLLPVRDIITKAAKKVSAFAVMLPLSVVIGMIACNQTLAIMLTDQLCRHLEPDRESFALQLADTAVVISPLIPWSIAGTVPLSSCGAPAGARFFAFFLYLLPLCSLVLRRKRKR